ncbi:MAG TPA: amphi-Trp domain-containing protein [Pyrinomonadaceae bacterium]|jgi:amphi-Trp domain-containing protein
MEREIELEKVYSNAEVIGKLRRLADALEAGKTFQIQIAGKRIGVPPSATVEFEYQKNEDGEEMEIEIKWKKR